MTNREKLCKKFIELTGGHWHENPKPEYCDGKLGGRCKIMRDVNPDYENPADVLKKMMERDDVKIFLLTKLHNQEADNDVIDDLIEHSPTLLFFNTVPISYIIKPDKLLKAAVEFLEERNGE